ncbi:phage holin family protein [Streptomyces sp. JJ38]|uniref:phage holin family protein n=1 Tax=Streptomyces sp. JJ38 TaxID=2738128 RepID=UPI001C58D0B4|nr:phage holin family protein [Streptomyces sp. JJ38]MBW1596005.1 phage holin family protein [Streptomyces sp. JJ38]
MRRAVRSPAGRPESRPAASPSEPASAETQRRIFREEFGRAKAELREETLRAGRNARAIGGAVFAGYMVACFFSLTLMFLLWGAMDLRWSALIVTGLWAVVGLVLISRARGRSAASSPGGEDGESPPDRAAEDAGDAEEGGPARAGRPAD